MRRALGGALAVLALIAVSGCSSSSKSGGSSDTRISGLETFKDLKNDHKRGRLSYDHKPPVGGTHSPVWLRCDVYTTPVPDESAVHSLEHGAVWITYQDSLPAADVATLVKLDELNPDYVLISPYQGQPEPISATAWGLQITTDKADDPRLAAFVKAYAGGDQGGEGGADCRNRGATPSQAEQYLTQSG